VAEVRRAALTFTLTQETIDRWARLGGDFNPLHVDPEFAAKSRFEGTIAHGTITLSLMERLMVEQLGEQWLNGGALTDIRFVAPVRPGREYELVAEQPGPEAPWRLEIRDAIEGTVCAAGDAIIESQPPA
jgi:acyl dehydratase